MALPQGEDEGAVIACAFYGVEIGDINLPERRQREKPGEDVRGAARRRQWRFDRPVIGAVAGMGTDDDATLEVENGDDRETVEHEASIHPPDAA